MNTMVLPHLQYCLLNWANFKGDHNLGLRDRILTLQKSLVRIICGAGRISHADPLFAELATLKIDDLFAQSVRIFSRVYATLQPTLSVCLSVCLSVGPSVRPSVRP